MKLGLIGTGWIVQRQLPQMRGRGIEVGALAGTPRSAEKVEALAEANGVPERYTDYRKMIAEADIDTVYVGIPNALHLEACTAALEAGKHVICEKPVASNYAEAKAMADLARSRNLFLWEAVSTIYLPNFAKLRELLPRVGNVRIVHVNFSQYSSRFDAFREGVIQPAFDPTKSGGALMDLGLYNLHYILGLFGEPQAVGYQANVERGIDTSGVVTLDYGTFKAVSVAAKDCGAPTFCLIQGEKGYLRQDSAPNACGAITLHLNDGTEETFDENGFTEFEKVWDAEFASFKADLESGSTDHCYELLDQSLLVSRVQTEARLSAGVRFPADER